MGNQIALNSIQAFLDGHLKLEKQYFSRVYDYPELESEILKIFIDVWQLPEGAIPKKRQTDKFQMWINELREIGDLCGTSKRTRKAFELALERYNNSNFKPIVWHPLALKNFIIDAVGQIKRQEQEFKQEKKIETKIASQETQLKAIQDLKSLLKKDE